MHTPLLFSRRTMLLLGPLAAVGFAKETKFWNTKDPSQWSSEEIDRLVTRSPWAKEIKASIAPPERATDMGGGGGGGRPGGLSIPGMGGSRNGGINIPGIGGIPGIGSGGRGGQGRSSAPKTEMIVRWESAKPVLEALKTPLANVLADHFVISLNGVPSMYLRDQPEERSARLTIKGKPAVHSGVVQQAPGALTQSLLFGFSMKELSFSPDDEVTFTTHVNRTAIAAGFNLKEMTYRGELAV